MPYIAPMNRSFALIALSCLLLAGCGASSAGTPAPVSHYGSSAGEGSSGVHVVQSGDTLYSISRRYKVVMSEVVYTNSLSAPFMLHTGERLRLPPPNDYKVRAGDSISSIAQIFNVSTSKIARLNRLPAPYTIHPGQVIRLPSRSGKTAPIYREAAFKAPQNTIGQSIKPNPKPAAKAQKPIFNDPPARSSSKFLKPVNGRTISDYGPKKGGQHNDGINIAAPKGTPIGAAENGVVVYAGNELRGYGNLVLVRHDGGYMTAYAHMDQINVARGATIARGTKLGTVGSTGSVSSPQLHFEVRRGTKAINPKGYI